MLFEETPLPSTLRAELDRLEDGLVDLMANVLAADLGSSPVDQLSARIVINAIEGLSHRLVLCPPPEVTPGEIANEITELARTYIQTRHSGPAGAPIRPVCR